MLWVNLERKQLTTSHNWSNHVFCLRRRGIKPQRKNAGGRKSEQHPYHPRPKPFVCPKCSKPGVCIKNQSLQLPTSMQELTINLPPNPRSRGKTHHHHYQIWAFLHPLGSSCYGQTLFYITFSQIFWVRKKHNHQIIIERWLAVLYTA